MQDEKPISTRIASGLMALFFIVGIAAGYEIAIQRGASGPAGDISQPQDVDFSPVWKAWRVIDEKFVSAAVASSTPYVATSSEDSAQKRVWGMISGLAASLDDPYTFFLPPEENHQFSEDMSGQFEGVGMEIDVKDGILTVVSPIKGTPAYNAGIKAGDLILKIDEVSTEGMSVNSAVKKIRGPKGTQVKFAVFRQGWDAPKDIVVTRDVISVPTVTTEAKDGGVFVIAITTFTANSADLFRSALREFVQSGDSKLILDLRGNPGGYLDAAVDMASWFLPSGAVVVTEDYAGHAENIVHRSSGYDIFNKNLKMVILVDKGSASASEILAGALQSYRIAQLVGTNTFGKGSVQELIDITEDTSLKLTVARWLKPDGEHIPLTGIVPDTVVPFTDEDLKAGRDPQMERALEILTTI